MTDHATATRDAWLAARRELLTDEKAHMRAGDELARRRRELPWVEVEKEYVFQTHAGPRTLAELFDGRSQLLVYHFMLGADWDEGCVGCSFVADHLDGPMPHVNARDLTVLCASRAPLERIDAYKDRMGWDFEWVSSLDSEFNFDFQASFDEEQQRTTGMYNFEQIEQPYVELPGLSVFVRDGDRVLHTYSAYGRGLEVLDGAYTLLDLAPKGRQEEGLDQPGSWWRRHDEYQGSTA